MGDNFNVQEPATGSSFKAKNIGGVKHPGHILYDEAGNPVIVATQATLAGVLAVLQGTLGTQEKPPSSAVAITQSDINPTTAARELAIVCTSAGNVKIGFGDGSVITIPVGVGLTRLPWAVTQIYLTGTTATATYFNLA